MALTGTQGRWEISERENDKLTVTNLRSVSKVGLDRQNILYMNILSQFCTSYFRRVVAVCLECFMLWGLAIKALQLKLKDKKWECKVCKTLRLSVAKNWKLSFDKWEKKTSCSIHLWDFALTVLHTCAITSFRLHKLRLSLSEVKGKLWALSDEFYTWALLSET